MHYLQRDWGGFRELNNFCVLSYRRKEVCQSQESGRRGVLGRSVDVESRVEEGCDDDTRDKNNADLVSSTMAVVNQYKHQSKTFI